MTENKTCERQENKGRKLSTFINTDTIKVTGSMTGECLVHRKDPRLNISDAYFLEAGETREIGAGKSFAIMKSKNLDKAKFEAYMALETVKLEGPLVWTEIEAPESVISRLRAADDTVPHGPEFSLICLATSTIFVLILCSYFIAMEHMGMTGKAAFLILSAIGLGILVPYGLVEYLKYVKELLLNPGTNIFIKKKTYKISRDILEAASEKEADTAD